MSEEEKEKEAIKWLKKILEEEKIRSDYKSLSGLYGNQDVEIGLNLIEKQNKVIDLMAKEINKAYYDENHFYVFFEGNFDDKNLPKRINKIKEYFYKKVEEEDE